MISPFWGGTPYELLIVPRQHELHLHRADPADLAGMGRSVQRALAGLRSRLGDIAYNIMFHTAPVPAERRLPLARASDAQDLDPRRFRNGIRRADQRGAAGREELRTEVGAPA